jgi:AcrR family transcriptional regulator
MSHAIAPPPEAPRRDRILAAAERAFARHGFHGASMQHVALEAGMSAGNLYRTFPSKDAIVSGLAERDRVAMAQDFQALGAAPDLLAALDGLLRKHIVDEPVWRTQLVLEIWAEAARNPAIASLCLAMSGEVEEHLTRLVTGAQALDPGLAGGEPAFVIRAMQTVVAGLFKRRATEPAFDGDSEIALALGMIRGALDGTLKPYSPERTEP